MNNLRVKWVYETDTDANCPDVNFGPHCSPSATPTVMNGEVYFPDWNGDRLFAQTDRGEMNFERRFLHEAEKGEKSAYLLKQHLIIYQ